MSRAGIISAGIFTPGLFTVGIFTAAIFTAGIFTGISKDQTPSAGIFTTGISSDTDDRNVLGIPWIFIQTKCSSV